MRNALWPAIGLRRTFRYYWRRLQRVPESPTAVARGFAIGAAMAVTPFVGLHIWLALALSWLVGASLLATFIGTFIGNYITIIPILLLEHKMGMFIFQELGFYFQLPPQHLTLHFMVEHPLDFCHMLKDSPDVVLPFLLPLLLGSALLSGMMYLIFVSLIRDSIHNWQEKRKHAIGRKNKGKPA